MPTLRATLGVKGQRPVVGTWDNTDLASSFAALNQVTGQLTTRLVGRPAAKRRPGRSKTARLQHAFAAHLGGIARAYPATLGKPAFITSDTAPWPQGAGIAQVLAAHPHLQLYRFPSYSPQPDLIERFWRVLRRRAAHDRLFATMAELRTALRASLCYVRTMGHKVVSLLHSPRKQKQQT